MARFRVTTERPAVEVREYTIEAASEAAATLAVEQILRAHRNSGSWGARRFHTEDRVDVVEVIADVESLEVEP